MRKPSAKIPAILFVIATIAAIILFNVAHDNPYCLWAGLGCAAFAVLMLLITLTRFLRNRSIVSGLFIATTAVTVIYFAGARFISTAIPLFYTNAAVEGAEGSAASTGFFTPVLFAQIGLFAVWFLLVLFIIYVYVRPIKKIDYLLSQIISDQEIKKFKLGKGKQYRAIAEKLQILANEKHTAATKRAARLAKARARAQVKKDLVKQLVKEQGKIPTATPTE